MIQDKVFHVVLVDHGIRDPLRGRRYLTTRELTALLGDMAFDLPNGVVMLRVDEVTDTVDATENGDNT